MRVLVAGASGLVGSHLLPHLTAAGHTPIALSRDPAAHAWPDGVETMAWDGVSALPAVEADAVVNLVGERVIGKRWSEAQMRVLRSSRIDATSRIVEWIQERGGLVVHLDESGEGGASDAPLPSQAGTSAGARGKVGKKPRKRAGADTSRAHGEAGGTARGAGARPDHPPVPVLVNASAAGYYGIWPDGPCPEERGPGADFLAQLCADWEAEANQSPGRVAVLRFGHVLSDRAGYLREILPFARWGLAGPIAGGSQPMPWVHAEDVARAITWALARGDGTYNVVSPGAAGAGQRAFAKTLGKVLHRPQLPVPAIILRLRYGKAAGAVLVGGQDLRGAALAREGFRFLHTDLRSTLARLATSRRSRRRKEKALAAAAT